jgi:hypothetical protein
MPSKKKNKGKARKAKTLQERGHEQSSDEVGHVADSLKNILSVEDMMAKMRGQLVSSLGDGYHDQSLQLLDRKMCDYFLPDNSVYYDDEQNKKSANPENPTESEVELYKKSEVILKGYLRKAGGFEAMSNFLGGQGHTNLQAYQEFYDDIMTYHYGWFEIIFKDNRNKLLMACKSIAKFASVKLELEGKMVDEVNRMMALLKEIIDLFQTLVESHDSETCEDAGILEFD